MAAEALSRRERLVLSVGLTVLSLAAQLGERRDPDHGRPRRWPATRAAVRAPADEMTTARRPDKSST
jgi:hypothetical protein